MGDPVPGFVRVTESVGKLNPRKTPVSVRPPIESVFGSVADGATVHGPKQADTAVPSDQPAADPKNAASP